MKLALHDLYLQLKAEIQKLPDSQDRQDSLRYLESCFYWAQEADRDIHYNLQEKAVVRDSSGEVIGLQG